MLFVVIYGLFFGSFTSVEVNNVCTIGWFVVVTVAWNGRGGAKHDEGSTRYICGIN